MNVSARLKLPFLVPGQAQKEVFHNEALQALDMLVHCVCEDAPTDDPPATPAIGEALLVGPRPSGAWMGHPHAIACWTDGGWRFQEPFYGLQVMLKSSGLAARFDGEEWRVGVLDAAVVRIGGEQVLSSRQPAIGEPAGGALIDREARDAVVAILAALKGHGLIATQ